MSVTTNEHGQQNMWAKEPIMYITEEDMVRYEKQPYAERAEAANSRFAMIGIAVGLISYALTGKLFFGVF
jgi:hypothetical protein